MPYGAHSSFPGAILHIDGDAFFASCEQALNPALRGKPVVTGKERGIAASMSYEAKARGVTRAMRLSEIRKICPDVILLPSDYETYSILSKRFFAILRRYTPSVEEYGIDEGFADITGLRRPLHKSYQQIAEAIQNDLTAELGFTFSIGLAPTKVLAKIASKWNKPHGLTVIRRRDIQKFLAELPVTDVWGIGSQTTAFLAKFGIRTALQFAERPEAWVQQNFSKPFYEIWQELNGASVMGLATEDVSARYSIQKMKTFTPPSSDRAFVFGQMSKNIESACIRARRYGQAAREVIFILRTQEFRDSAVSARLSHPTAHANEIVAVLDSLFDDFFDPTERYRLTGVILAVLVDDTIHQLDLFGSALKAETLSRVYESIDELAARYGKHTVFLASSVPAHTYAQHTGARGDLPMRRSVLFTDENKRKRLGIPLLTGTLR